MLRPHHVRARVEKRGDLRVHTGATASNPQYAPCPGWLVFRQNSKRAIILACYPCNERVPENLRVTDEDVRGLPEAQEALRLRKQELDVEVCERRITRHWQAPPYTPADIPALCGRSEFGTTPRGRRTHVTTGIRERVSCAECLRLLAMTPAQRAEEVRQRSVALAQKFSADKQKRAIGRAIGRAFARMAVELGRAGALASLDAVLAVEEPGLWRVCGNFTEEVDAMVGNSLALARAASLLDFPKWQSSEREHDVIKDNEGSYHCRYCRRMLDERPGWVRVSDVDRVHRDHLVVCALRYLAEPLLGKSSEGEP